MRRTARHEPELGIAGAARLLGLSMTHIYRLIYEGKLPARKRGRRWRIARAAVQQRLHGAGQRSWQETRPTSHKLRPPQDLDKLIGAGAHLWKSDEEFESFLAGIYQRRKEDLDRELGRRIR